MRSSLSFGASESEAPALSPVNVLRTLHSPIPELSIVFKTASPQLLPINLYLELASLNILSIKNFEDLASEASKSKKLSYLSNSLSSNISGVGGDPDAQVSLHARRCYEALTKQAR